MTVSQPLVAVIGFGAIGRQVHALLKDDFRFGVLLREGARAATDLPDAVLRFETFEALLDAGPRIVVEAAGSEALREFAPKVLAAGIDLVAASTGVFGSPDAMAGLMAQSTSGARLIVPAGAIGGLDYLGALRGLADARVTYTSRKPPAAWRAELEALGYAGGEIERDVVLFEGTPEEAARLYPRNLNAGLTIALAAGFGRTRVRVIADPQVALNTHEIETWSEAGTGFLRFANQPSASNPKSSAITGYSIAAAVRRQFAFLIV